MVIKNITVWKSSIKGKRSTNEDVELDFINLKGGTTIDCSYAPIDLFIVCDGHGGSEVSNSVAPMLKDEFINSSNQFPLSNTKINNIYDRIQTKLINNDLNIANRCGTTALVVIRYIKDDKYWLQVINLGDCRAIASIKGLAVPLTKDHKPNWPDEQKRIDDVNKSSGSVKKIRYDCGDWRVGDLSVSRSFGDLDNVPHVTHLPDIYNYELNKDYEYIIIACDGLWDVLSNHVAVNLVKNSTSLYNSLHNVDNVARNLTSAALSHGSTDNVSVIVIKF